MKLLKTINLVLFTLLSISTGIFKLLEQEADIELFLVLGFDEVFTTLLGGVQLVGGLLLIFRKSRKTGAFVLLPTFIIASLAVFMNEMWSFGIVSLVFIVMNLLIIKEHTKGKNK